MAKKLTQADIARQTLIQLAKKGEPPTPENYSTTYQQIAGQDVAGTQTSKTPSVNSTLEKVLAKASETNPKFHANEKAINNAVKKQDWLKTQRSWQKKFKHSCVHGAMAMMKEWRL